MLGLLGLLGLLGWLAHWCGLARSLAVPAGGASWLAAPYSDMLLHMSVCRHVYGHVYVQSCIKISREMMLHAIKDDYYENTGLHVYVCVCMCGALRVQLFAFSLH